MVKRYKEEIRCEREKFETYLHKAGLMMTMGRQVVFEEVMRAHGHFAAEELAKQCKDNQQPVSRATVYRTIKELLESCVIRETAFGDKHHHYEHIYDERPHHHARCVRCGHNLEFPDLGEDKIYRPYLEKKGFQILGHEMHFYGVCKECS